MDRDVKMLEIGIRNLVADLWMMQRATARCGRLLNEADIRHWVLTGEYPEDVPRPPRERLEG